ncbi:MAG TPA: hypothetical protein VIA62_26240 [Thermoanaerobaculia bacterium]|nr:hypothetical protein [Thermoanaerobaculia bacterium]
MSDEKADTTPQRDDLATLVAYARQNPKVAGALLADLEGLIRDQNLSIDTASAAYQELVLRLYHARVVLDRNLDDFQNRAAAGLLGAAGGRAAYAAAARPEDLNAAYLNSAQPQDLNAAYLNAARSQDLSAAYLTAAGPQDLNAAYLNAAHPQDLNAAYLTAARPQDLNAAYLNAARPEDLSAAYLTAANPGDLPTDESR